MVREVAATKPTDLWDWEGKAKVHAYRCPLCHTPVDGVFPPLVAICQRDRSGFSATTLRCPDCGHVFISPRMTAQDYDEFYRSGAYRRISAALGGGEPDRDKLLANQRNYAQSVLLDYVLQGVDLSGAKTLLDVGGSTGVVASMVAQRYGLEATVLDPAADELEHAKTLGCRVIEASMEAWLPDREYDVVLLCQTLEHLLEPVQMLRRLRHCLAPRGVLVVDVIDFPVRARAFGVERACKIDHPHAFSMPTAMTAIGLAGLGIASWSSVDCNKERAPGTHIKHVFVCRDAVGR